MEPLQRAGTRQPCVKLPGGEKAATAVDRKLTQCKALRFVNGYCVSGSKRDLPKCPYRDRLDHLLPDGKIWLNPVSIGAPLIPPHFNTISIVELDVNMLKAVMFG